MHGPSDTGFGVGASLLRKEDARHLHGRGQFVSDVKLANTHDVAFVRSPHAHARIKGIVLPPDADGRVFTARDLPRLAEMRAVPQVNGFKVSGYPPLATQKVRYVGDAIAACIAPTRAEAEDLASSVSVDFEVLPAIIDAVDALTKTPSLVHESWANNLFIERVFQEGNLDEVARTAEVVVRRTYRMNRHVAVPLEGRAVLAYRDHRLDELVVYTSTQVPHIIRLGLSEVLGLEERNIRVIAPDVGGGFGSKIFIYPEEVVCLWASKKVRRPVKWVSDRTEAFLADAHGRDHVTDAEMAFDADHRITAIKAKTVANLGAYMSTFSSSVPTYLYATLLSGQYDVPQIYCEVDAVYTNTVPVDAYRGAGRPEATFVVERLVEVAARELGVDPAELRRKNFIKQFPHQTPVIMNYDAGDYLASLKKALELADHKGFAKRKRESERHGKLRGIGLSTYIEACGIAPSQAVGSLGAGVGLWESAEVRVNPTGSVEVLTGSHSHGQGHETTFAQLVSERLGIPIENIAIVHGDTDKVQFGMGSYGSRSGAVGMSAIVKALDKVEAKAKKVASHLLEAAESDIVFKDGKFTVAGTDKSAAWGEVSLHAYIAHKFTGAQLEPGLKEGAFYDPTNFTFPAGCHVCEVEIDPETGITSIAHWTAVDDFGTVVNPMIVEGQVHGGIAQGIGQAMLENAIYSGDGQLVTSSLMDYTMPRANDLPSFTVGTTMTFCPGNPLGIKGCGEAGAIASPAAVINAITDAIGSEELAMPATPQAVWAAIEKHKLSHKAA